MATTTRIFMLLPQTGVSGGFFVTAASVTFAPKYRPSTQIVVLTHWAESILFNKSKHTAEMNAADARIIFERRSWFICDLLHAQPIFRMPTIYKALDLLAVRVDPHEDRLAGAQPVPSVSQLGCGRPAEGRHADVEG
jgi:hypothetical protein